MGNGVTINGVELGVSVQDAKHLAPILIGLKDRSFSGKLLETVRARKEQYSFKTQPLSQSDANAWRGLLQGLGYTWSWDADLYSDGKGLGNSAGAGSSVSAPNPAGSAGPKYGAKCLDVTNANGSVTYSTALGSSWTVGGWVRSNNGVWVHWIFTSAGTYYSSGVAAANQTFYSVDGSGNLKLFAASWPGGVQDGTIARNTAYTTGATLRYFTASDGNVYLYQCTTNGTTANSAPSYPTAFNATVTDGTAVFTNAGPADGYYDDWFALPYVMPASWAASWYAYQNTQAIAPLPTLTVGGPPIANPTRVMQGKLADAAELVAVLGGSFAVNNEVLEFTLEDV